MSSDLRNNLSRLKFRILKVTKYVPSLTVFLWKWFYYFQHLNFLKWFHKHVQSKKPIYWAAEQVPLTSYLEAADFLLKWSSFSPVLAKSFSGQGFDISLLFPVWSLITLNFHKLCIPQALADKKKWTKTHSHHISTKLPTQLENNNLKCIHSTVVVFCNIILAQERQ
jgi:hypothetical protein